MPFRPPLSALLIVASALFLRPDAHAVIEAYYAAYAREDLDALLRLWSAKSPDLAPHRKALEKFFADHDRVEVKAPAVRQVNVEGTRARARLSFELSAVEAKTGKPAAGLGRRNRTFHLAREEEGWKIWREEPTEEEIAAALLAAGTDAERSALLAAEKEFLTEDLARALYRQGTVLRAEGKSADAIGRYRLLQTVSEYTGDKANAVRALIGLGKVYGENFESAPALEHYLNALRESEALGDQALLIAVLNNLGGTYDDIGQHAQAIEYYRRSLRLSEATNNRQTVAHTSIAIGGAMRRQGAFAEAMSWTRQGLSLAEAIKYQVGIAIGLDTLLNLSLDLGDYDQALEYAGRVLSMSEASGSKFTLALGYQVVGQVHLRRGDHDRALEYLAKARPAVEEHGNKPLLAQNLNWTAEAHQQRGDSAEAIKYLQRSLEVLAAIHDPGRVMVAHHLLAQAHLTLGDYPRALESARRSAEIAGQIRSPLGLLRAQNTAGRIFRAMRAPERARRAFEEAIGEAEALRLNVAGAEREQQEFFARVVEPYYGLVGLLLERGEAGEALTAAERAKARVLVDVLRGGRPRPSKSMTAEEREREAGLRAEMTSLNEQLRHAARAAKPDQARVGELEGRLNKARLEYESFRTALYALHPELRGQRGEMRPVGAEEAAALLPDAHSALIEYAVADEATYLFVLTRSGLKGYKLPVKSAALGKRVEEFRRLLADRKVEFRGPARGLYDLLLEPAREQLRGKTSLVIVPDGALWELPFQALLTGTNRYLLEESAVSYAPSLTALREMAARRKRLAAPEVGAAELLAFGNPALGAETLERAGLVRLGGRFEPLPEAEREVNALARMYGPGRSRVYIGAEAREGRAKAESGRYRVLHFATHAVLNDAAPMYSHLMLAPSAGDEDGLLEAWEFMEMELRADLVVLSACETGRGRVGAGEGVVGLSWALMVAGSPAALVSQWKVESVSTTRLMLEFHHALRAPGQTKARALQAAARRMMSEGSTRHPFYWAGFILVGD